LVLALDIPYTGRRLSIYMAVLRRAWKADLLVLHAYHKDDGPISNIC
jgi:hypothetical protein